MKTVRKNVYYCEYCKKKGLSVYHMKEHESYCTGNLDRRCGVCDCKIDYVSIVQKFKAQMKSREVEHCDGDFTCRAYWTEIVVEQKPSLDEIFDAVEDCPACVLTILRACGLCGHEWDMKFEWKTERDKWWADHKPTDVEW